MAVLLSGLTASIASSGQSSINSTPGNRSCVAKEARGSMMETAYPESAAIGARSWLI